jgi:hypothetical protein
MKITKEDLKNLSDLTEKEKETFNKKLDKELVKQGKYLTKIIQKIMIK